MEKRMPPSQYETPVLNQAQKDDCMKRHKILPINQLDPFLNFYGLNELTFYIFPQSFTKICLLVEVLDRFQYFHVINFRRFRDLFEFNFYCFLSSLIMDVVILVFLSFSTLKPT